MRDKKFSYKHLHCSAAVVHHHPLEVVVLLASYPHCTWAVAAAVAGVAIPAAEDQEALAADALRGGLDDLKNRS